MTEPHGYDRHANHQSDPPHEAACQQGRRNQCGRLVRVAAQVVQQDGPKTDRQGASNCPRSDGQGGLLPLPKGPRMRAVMIPVPQSRSRINPFAEQVVKTAAREPPRLGRRVDRRKGEAFAVAFRVASDDAASRLRCSGAEAQPA